MQEYYQVKVHCQQKVVWKQAGIVRTALSTETNLDANNPLLKPHFIAKNIERHELITA